MREETLSSSHWRECASMDWSRLRHDPSGESKADVHGSALKLPFKSSSFYVVLCTQVLEHVTRPGKLFREVARVLKPQGLLILTVPQTTPLHEEPEDYYRFTCYGLTFLAGRAGLEVVRVTPVGGAIATVGQLVLWHLNFLRRFPLIGPALAMIARITVGWFSLKLDRLSTAYGGGAVKNTINWVLTARKPG
jgi:SAM-dependent methyltransferase